MKKLFLLLATLPLLGSAAEPQSLMTVPGKLLLNEDFTGSSLPANWKPGGRANSFTIVDGALQGVCAPDDGHGPAIAVPIEGRNLSVRFAMKYTQPGYFLFLLNGDSQFGGDAHLLRVALSPSLVAVQQDRGSRESKSKVDEERQKAVKAGQKPAAPTKEQLADPKFYRIERLASQKRNIADGQWHNVLVEVSGNDVVVQVDDGPPLIATGTVLDVKKSRFVFLVGNRGTALIDRVKVWENSPDAGWPARKAKLPVAPEGK